MREVLRFLVERLGAAALTLLAVSVLIYGLVELMPGDYADRELFRKYAGSGAAITQAELDEVRVRLGLDRSFMVRYVEWISGIVTRFDFGISFRVGGSVSALLGDKILFSMMVVAGAMLLSYAIAIPVGLWTGAHQGSWADWTVVIVSYLGLAIPNFALALLLLWVNTLIFDGNVTGLFSEPYRSAPWSWDRWVDFASHAYVPVLILGWSSTAYQLQTVRAIMREEMSKFYVVAAQARGLPYWRILLRYPARHAMVPIVSTIGFDFSRAFNELPIVASILALGEVGQELLLAFLDADQNAVSAILLAIAAIMTALNLVSDLVVRWLDPRTRYPAVDTPS